MGGSVTTLAINLTDAAEKEKTHYSDEATIEGLKWRMSYNHLQLHKQSLKPTFHLECLTPLQSECVVKYEFTFRHSDIKTTSGTLKFGEDRQRLEIYHCDEPIWTLNKLWSGSLKLNEVLPPGKVAAQFKSPFDGIETKTEDAVLAMSLEERPSSLLNNKLMSDVTFQVGSRSKVIEFFGHKFILALSSPVFRAMLMPEQGLVPPAVIEVPDVHPTAFMTMLRFIYRKETLVAQNMIQDTLYVAEKYDVKGFTESLSVFLTSNTVIDFLPFVKTIGPTHVFYEECVKILKKDIQEIMKSEAFLLVDEEIMRMILSADDIKVKEIDLFNRYVKWAEKQCQEEKLEFNEDNKKKFMKDHKLIRYPLMTAEEFTLGPSKTGLLTSDEKVSIYEFISAKVPTSLITKNRIP